LFFVEIFKKYLKSFFNLRKHCPYLAFRDTASRSGGDQVGVGDVAALPLTIACARY